MAATGEEPLDMLLLQERCRKDPESYREEYVGQRRHFEALLSGARLQPSAPSRALGEVASFMGAVSHCYGDDIAGVVTELVALLSEHGAVMDSELRRSLVRLLGLLRARNVADPAAVLPLFFKLLRCEDKALRRVLHGHIVADVKKLTRSGHPIYKALHASLVALVADADATLVRRCLHVLIDLFRRRVWADARCANMVARAAFHPAAPVALVAVRFVLDANDSAAYDADADGDDDDDDAAGNTARKGNQTDGRRAAEMWKAYNMTGKKSSKKKKKMERVISRMTRTKNTTTADATVSHERAAGGAVPLMLLHDPQDFAERLFAELTGRRRKDPYDRRLVYMDLVSRLVGTHHLLLLNFYPFAQRYLHPSQPEVTKVLACLTQAVHDLVPADVLHPVLRALADSFVSERSSPAAMAAGINAIRAICARAPLAILDAENDELPPDQQSAPLLLDLAQYKSSKDQGVTMAARSLIALYREVNPALLLKKDRGKTAGIAVQRGNATRARAYGEHVYATGVEGVELLNENSSDDDIDEDDEEDENNENEGSCAQDVQEKESRSVGSDDAKDGDKGGGNREMDDTEGQDEIQADGDMDASDEEVNKGEGDDDNIEGEEIEGSNNADEDDDDMDTVNSTKDGATGDSDMAAEEASDRKVDEMRILSDEDYAKIRARQLAKEMGESSLITTNTGSAVDPDDIQGPLKQGRRTLAERLETVMEGREGREKFGSKKGLNKGGGSSNKKKLKTKSNSMVIHKRRRRMKQMGRREKQLMKRKKNDYK